MTSGKRTPLPMLEMQEIQVRSLSWKEPLEEDIATHSSIPVWRISWTEEPGGQSQRHATQEALKITRERPKYTLTKADTGKETVWLTRAFSVI